MLKINMEFKKGILFVRLKGILNGDTSIMLDYNLNDMIKVNGIKYVLLNFKDVIYLDKYAIDVIVDNYNSIKASNGKLILCGLDNCNSYNNTILDNLYQVSDEEKAYGVVTL